MRTSRDKKLFNQFQPSAIEIIESPPSPIGHITIWLIFLIVASSITLACVGEVDQIAMARGKVIPHGQIKTMQTAEQGVITDIFVAEGDIVEKGQVLLELDSTFSEIDFETAEQRLNTLKLEKKLLEQEVEGKKKINTDESGLDASAYAYQLKLQKMRKEDYDEKKALYEIEISKAKKDKEKAEIDLEYYTKQVRILEDQERKTKILLDSGSIPLTDYQQVVNELELTRNKEKSAEVMITSSEDQITKAKQSLSSLKQSYETDMVQLVVQKDKEILEAKSNLDKMKKKYQMHNLTAPVSGRVSGIGAHTIGGVVTPAQPILTIVPKGTPLIIEATVLNRDIGFIEVGQECDIKLDAFPFQKYGVITGHITYISPDAFEDKRLGYVYKIHVEPKEEFIELTNKRLNMTPGMTTSVEIKLDRRRIIEFFLPAIDYVKESFEL